MTLPILKDLGFSDKEALIYETILEQGALTPAKVSQSTGINRSTVYSVTKELISRGVVAEDHTKKPARFVALPLHSLENIVLKEERLLQDKKLLVNKAMKELESLTRKTSVSEPKLTFIFEENLEDFLYTQAPEWDRSTMRRDGVWWGFQNTSFVKYYQKWINWFWKECVHEELILKVLSNESEYEKQVAAQGYTRRLVKFWNKGAAFTATTWVCGDYIIMIVMDQKPHYLVQIHDKVLAHNMREMFKSIWESEK